MAPIVDSVRPARPDEVPAVLGLWGVARSPAATTGDDTAMVGRLLAHDPGALLVARRGGLVVGTAIAAWDGWRGTIYRLAVLPEHRLQGVGRSLVDAAQERLRELGATRVNAVGQDDAGPVAFWAAIGFRPDPGMARFAKGL